MTWPWVYRGPRFDTNRNTVVDKPAPSAYAWMYASAASFDAPYSDVCTGNGQSSGVGIDRRLAVDRAGRGEHEPADTPARRAASSTLCVTMTFCSRSRRGASQPKRTSALAARWTTASAPARTDRQVGGVEQVELDELERGVGDGVGEELAPPGREVVEPDAPRDRRRAARRRGWSR